MAVTDRLIITATQPSAFKLSLHGVQGWLHGLRQIPERYRRAGEAGSGRQSMGTEAPQTELRGWIACSASAVAIATCTRLESLTGYTVAIADQWGRTFPRVTIDSVEVNLVRTRGPDVTAGVRATHRIDVVIRCEVQP